MFSSGCCERIFHPEKIPHPPGLPLQCTRSKASQVNSNRRWPVISSPILGQRIVPKNSGFLKKRFFHEMNPLLQTKNSGDELHTFHEMRPSSYKKIVVKFTTFLRPYFWRFVGRCVEHDDVMIPKIEEKRDHHHSTNQVGQGSCVATNICLLS